MTRRQRVLVCGALLAAAVGLAACGTGSGTNVVTQPRQGRAGVQLAGTVGARQVAVSDGTPRLIVGDCDPQDGPDRDVCFVSSAIDGTPLRLLFENPDVLAAGESVPVADVGCAAAACDHVTDGAVVDLQVGAGGPTRRADDGLVTMSLVEPGLHYVGTLTLEFRDGRLAGGFDVVPRPR